METWLCPEFGAVKDKRSLAELEKFIHHIADSSGLLLPRGVIDGQEHFAFAHLSFQEYFTACWLEQEFSRLLNAGVASDDLLDAPTTEPPQALAMTQKLFAQYAAQTVWREPLLFLAEKLADRPADTSTLRKWLFPIKAGDTLPMPAQQLLATLSIDPQVSFTLPQRQVLWEYLCKAHLANKMVWKGGVAPSLLPVSDYQADILALLSKLAAVSKQTELSLSYCTGIRDLSPLKPLQNLERLDLSSCTGISDLSALQHLQNLQRLSLSGCTWVSNLSALQHLQSLQVLDLMVCTAVSDLSPLQPLQSLQRLYLSGCTGISDLSALQQLQSLQVLSLSLCTEVRDLSALQPLQSLEWLYLSDCPGISDLFALQHLQSLQRLHLGGRTGVSDLKAQVAALRIALPECRIFT